MSQTIQITYDGTTLDLNAGSYRVADGYFPNNANERMDVLIVADTLSALETALQEIRRALDYARRFANEPEPAYQVYAADSSMTAMRTRILNATMVYETKYFARRRRYRARVAIAIQHDPFWEALSESEISLTSTEGSGTGGVTIYNQWGTSHKNYAAIAAASIGGDLPAPVKLKLTAVSGYGFVELYAGHNWRSEPTDMVPLIEGETASGGSSVSDSDASGGNERSYSFVNNNKVNAFIWTLSSSWLDDLKGRYFRLLARFTGGAVHTSTTYQWVISHYSTPPGGAALYYPIWSGPLVKPTASPEFYDFGIVQLPPWLYGVDNSQQLYLQLYVQLDSGVTPSGEIVAIDMLYFLPLDSYRYYDATANVVQIVDDGPKDIVYRQASGDINRASTVKAIGKPIMLQPGVDQRLYFLWEAVDSTPATLNQIDCTATVQAWYRQRRYVP